MSDEELLRDFFEESREHLARLDDSLTRLEWGPYGRAAVAEAYRAVHALAGTSGLFGFKFLGGTAKASEKLLGAWRDGRVTPSPELLSLLKEAASAMKGCWSALAEGRGEPDGDPAVAERLEAVCRGF